jgi:REP-associated tyrosine transposase
MAYRPRDERPGYHHVVARGNNKQLIFLSDRDRTVFLWTLDRVAKKHGWEILAYCLMRNHYHLVIQVGDRGLARGMCELNTGYALHFNGAHGRINHLFGKRYWSEFLASEPRLLNTIRYVVQNPRRAGIAGPLESHTWTSYRATIGLAFGLAQFRRDAVLELFGGNPLTAILSFAAFCGRAAPSGEEGEALPHDVDPRPPP